MSEEIVCVRCGARPQDPQEAGASWSFGTERGRVVWSCPECTRANARAIEGKLDSEWW